MNSRLFKEKVEEKHSKTLYQPLKDGDIIISLNKIAPKVPTFDRKLIVEFATHAVIYFESKIIHSSPGFAGARVKNKSVYKEFEKDEPFGTSMVLSCKDPEMRANIVKNCKLVTEAKAFTPFEYYDARREDFSENKISEFDLKKRQLEFFRAFRAYNRIQALAPISKNKGISCGNFVSYIAKSSIIDKFFPKGLPEKIQENIAAIENLRITKANKKLDKVDEKEFAQFEKTVVASLPKSIDLSLMKDLYRPVKKRSVNEFLDDALLSDRWEFGYLFYDQGASPSMMKHELYVEFNSLVKDKKGLNLHYVKNAVDKFMQSSSNKLGASEGSVKRI